MDDTERKLLRIIYNVYGQTWHTPNWPYLCRLSQRKEGQVKAAIRGLIEQRYIEAQNGKIRVIEAWERQQPRWRPMD